MKKVTIFAKNLYNELKRWGVDCELEGKLEKKHVDILIHNPKIAIEVDGPCHFTNPKQIVTDFHRDDYSSEEGYHTFRVPNDMIDNHLEQITRAIVRIVNANKK